MPPTPRSLGGATVSTALDDLPDVNVISDLLTTDRLVLSKEQLRALRQATSPYTRSLRSRRGLGYTRVWDQAVLTGCQRTLHSAEVRTRFLGLKPGEEDEVSRTSRLAGEGRAQTLPRWYGSRSWELHRASPDPSPSPEGDHGAGSSSPALIPGLVCIPRSEVARPSRDWELSSPRLAEAVAKTIVRSLEARPTKPMVALMPGDDALLRMSLLQAADYSAFRTMSSPAMSGAKRMVKPAARDDRS